MNSNVKLGVAAAIGFVVSAAVVGFLSVAGASPRDNRPRASNLSSIGDVGVCLEGATVDEFEACFAAADPTADRTITFQNVTGTVYVSGGTDVTLADGGTNKSMTAVAGAVTWSDTDSLELSAAGTANDVLISNGTSAPSWTAAPTLTSVAVSAGVTASGPVATACTGDKLAVDNNGIQDCQLGADATPDVVRVFAHAAPTLGAGGNQTGASLYFAGGPGTRRAAVTAASFVNNTTTITLTLDGSATVGTEGTAFECDSVTDTVCAVNVAAWATTLTGIDSCAGANCSFFTGVAGTFYVYRAVDEPATAVIGAIATSTGAALTIVTGSDGQIRGGDGTALLPNYSFVDDPDTGIFSNAANQVGFAAGGTAGFFCTSSQCSVGTTLPLNVRTDATTAFQAGSAATQWFSVTAAGVIAVANGAPLQATGTITSSLATSIGWAVVDGTDNTACTAQCTSAAVFGFDLAGGATAPVIVGSADATADICLCAGSS